MASKRRLLRLNSDASVYGPRGLDRFSMLRRLSRTNVLALLTAVIGVVLLVYLLTGQLWFLLFAVAVTATGVDGFLRTNPTGTLRRFRETALYLFVPVLFTLGAGVFFRYTLSGLWEVPAAIVSAGVLGSVIYAEYRSVDASGDHFLTMRLILNLAGYLAAFTLYTALYNQNLALPLAALLVGLVSFFIGVDILRELDLKTDLLLIYAVTLGFVVAQARWALNFISLTGWLGGVFILIVFYVASQVLQSYLWGRLDRRVVLEFSIVGAVGTLLVVVGRLVSQG